jgi:septum formation protein
MSFKFILASESPRRKELLQYFKFPFTVRSPKFDELKERETRPLSKSQILARGKKDALLNELLKDNLHVDCWVLAADTVVDYQGKCLEKPSSEAEAKSMLQMLSGQVHEVHTSVSIGLLNKKLVKEINFTVSTKVEFDFIDETTLDIYLKSGDSMDKAGAYGIQGMPLTFIKSVHGSFSNVMGLPVDSLRSVFVKELGENWREKFIP